MSFGGSAIVTQLSLGCALVVMSLLWSCVWDRDSTDTSHPHLLFLALRKAVLACYDSIKKPNFSLRMVLEFVNCFVSFLLPSPVQF